MWDFSLSFFSLQHNTEVDFSVWDMAGQEVYYATHQCFLSRNTLYLVVWNMEEKEKGIDYLRPWLLNIQVHVRRFNSALLICLLLAWLDSMPNDALQKINLLAFHVTTTLMHSLLVPACFQHAT